MEKEQDKINPIAATEKKRVTITVEQCNYDHVVNRFDTMIIVLRGKYAFLELLQTLTFANSALLKFCILEHCVFFKGNIELPVWNFKSDKLDFEAFKDKLLELKENIKEIYLE